MAPAPGAANVGAVATLVSVNVGLPQDVAWQGRTVHTGVWKAPVDGPRMVRRLNIDGDGQGDLAGHGGEHRAVLVYQLDSYRHWASTSAATTSLGQFGENFTVDGLPDDEVCIGDRYRIGEARVRGDPAAGHLLPGRACASASRGCRRCWSRTAAPASTCGSSPRASRGRRRRSSRSPPARSAITVAEIDALLYLPGHDPRPLARALRHPGAQPGLEGLPAGSARPAGRRRRGNAGLAAVAPAAGVAGFPSAEGDRGRAGERRP